MTSKTAMAASAAPRAMFHAALTPHLMLRGPQVAYAPDGAPLSVEAAVAALREPPQAAETPDPTAAEEAPAGEPAAEPEAEEVPEPESEAEPTAEEPLDPEAVIEGEAEAEEPESDPRPVIAAPKSWDAAERAVFATLPPATQAIIASRENERDKVVSRAQQESTQARKTVEAELAGLAQVKTTFDEIATRANKVFADKWVNVDWVALARSDPATYTIARAEHDAEMGELQRVQEAQIAANQVKKQAEQTAFQSYVQGEFAELSEVAPDLVDQKTGNAKRTEVTEFLRGLRRSNGDRAIADENITRIAAVEMSLARDAMEFRKLKAAGKATAARPAAPATRPAAAPARAAAPSAAPPQRPTPQRNIEAAKNRFAQSGSTDDAVAFLRASRGAN